MKEQLEQLQCVDHASWRREALEHEEHFLDLHDYLPKELLCERELLICRLGGDLRQIGSFACFSKGGKGEPVVQKPEGRNSSAGADYSLVRAP